MAHTFIKTVRINWKLNTSLFQVINKDVLTEAVRRFGTSVKATNIMLARTKMMEILMPPIVGLSKEDQGWQKAISNYWHGLQLEIPQNGKELNIGFTFSLDDNHDERKQYISTLNKSKSIKTDKDLAEYVMTNIKADEWYKYGIPVEAQDYLVYVYSFDYACVANTPDDAVSKTSSNIRFYIHDESLVEEANKKKAKEVIKAQSRYYEILKDKDAEELVKNILIVLEPSSVDVVLGMSIDDRQIKLFKKLNDDSDKFLSIANDTNVLIKSHIEQLISSNILKRLDNSDIIVDYDEPSIVLGNTTNETISWFSQELNKPKASEYMNRLKK